MSPRRKLLAAIAIGVVLAGPPVAALNIWLGGLVERQGREELDELTGLLKDNLGKVVQHGKRADSIVRNMLQHSREGSEAESSRPRCRPPDVRLADRSSSRPNR